MGKIATKYLKTDPWKLIESGYRSDRAKTSESVFSLANEYSGVRGFMEESRDGNTLIGTYFNGLYEWAEKENEHAYKGIVRRGHYMVNAVNFLKCSIQTEGVRLEPVSERTTNFLRELDMRRGHLTRSYDFETPKGKVKVTFERFLDMENCERSYQKIVLESEKFMVIEAELFLDFDVNHWGKAGRWSVENRFNDGRTVWIKGKTASTDQRLTSAMRVSYPAGSECFPMSEALTEGVKIVFPLNGKAEITRYVVNLVEKNPLQMVSIDTLKSKIAQSEEEGYENARIRNDAYWNRFWANSDIEIDGNEEDQQGIRFCIFQLQQTYHGADPKNNIGAKGLTGEAYSGHAFWDTETYCLPYFLFNNPRAARDLLLFRYHTLSQAKERAKMLDCRGACYPIATLNGAEACDLWQHASLQFQPSTGVAYGIWHYVRVTEDEAFLLEYGFEMLLEISVFLMSRGDYNGDRTKFGFYCVMGPDEFQMMVNHNCYTNYMAKKTFEYTLEVAKKLKVEDSDGYKNVLKRVGFAEELFTEMEECADKMLILYDDKTKLFEQHEKFYDLPHVDIHSIPVTDFPLYGHWSYDRIYRNDMIKQPDVLMFMLLYNGDFDAEQKVANYEFYEPRCIHESSLSPSVHSILASELGKQMEAVDFFGFATRMDLDDYNRNTCEGLHTTSIAAAWLNIVYGFGGLRSDGKILKINPVIPEKWEKYRFKITYRGKKMTITVTRNKVVAEGEGGQDVELEFCGNPRKLSTYLEEKR